MLDNVTAMSHIFTTNKKTISTITITFHSYIFMML